LSHVGRHRRDAENNRDGLPEIFVSVIKKPPALPVTGRKNDRLLLGVLQIVSAYANHAPNRAICPLGSPRTSLVAWSRA
jgi:hypothetical protein